MDESTPGLGQAGGGTAGAGAATIPGQSSGGQGSFNGAGGAPGAMPWESDERFRGKGPEDVWKSYTEAQKKLGGLPDIEKKLGQWEQFGKAWEPYLQRVGYDPSRLAHMLEQAAHAAQQRGQPQQAQQLMQQAQSWADAMTPESQEKWIDNRFTQASQQGQQQMQQVATALVDYFNRFGDLAMRAIEKKFDQLPENIRPKISVNDLLQEAVNIATNRYDPLEWAAKIRTAEPEETLRERIRTEERAKLEAENKNRSLTTFAGASTGAPRTLRPRNPVAAAQAGQGVPRVPEAEMIGRARDRFAEKWTDIAP